MPTPVLIPQTWITHHGSRIVLITKQWVLLQYSWSLHAVEWRVSVYHNCLPVYPAWTDVYKSGILQLQPNLFMKGKTECTLVLNQLTLYIHRLKKNKVTVTDLLITGSNLPILLNSPVLGPLLPTVLLSLECHAGRLVWRTSPIRARIGSADWACHGSRTCCAGPALIGFSAF